uniref:Uncharacterized protein n=1 Tax=Romanomermis culicivorax TaxID=13658 RepID=A0A915HUL4_ROMCU
MAPSTRMFEQQMNEDTIVEATTIMIATPLCHVSTPLPLYCRLNNTSMDCQLHQGVANSLNAATSAQAICAANMVGASPKPVSCLA